MLAIADLRLVYPGFQACYNLTVPEGMLCGVVGPSGGGKTTLLHAIAGFEQPVSGKVHFQGVDLLPLPPAARPLAMVFQEDNLFVHLTVAQNVGLAIRPSLRLNPEEKTGIEMVLEATGLAGLAARYPHEISGGQRQRVALARALASRKPLLLLDEPFGGLDPGLRAEMIDLVDRLRHENGLSVLLTIHTPFDLARHADAMAFIAEGQVLAFGKPDAVLRKGRDARIDAFLGEGG